MIGIKRRHSHQTGRPSPHLPTPICIGYCHDPSLHPRPAHHATNAVHEPPPDWPGFNIGYSTEHMDCTSLKACIRIQACTQGVHSLSNCLPRTCISLSIGRSPCVNWGADDDDDDRDHADKERPISHSISRTIEAPRDGKEKERKLMSGTPADATRAIRAMQMAAMGDDWD